MSIRVRLLLGYVAVVVILVASGALIIVPMSDELEGAVRRDAQALARALRAKVEQAVRARIQTIEAFAGTDQPLQVALATSNAAFARRGSDAAIRASIEEADSHWLEGSSTAFRNRLLRNDVARSLQRIQRFHKTRDGRSVFAEIFVTNRYGANVGQTGLTEDYDQKGEGWWDAAWERGTWASPDVELDDSAGVYSLDIGVRVDGPDRERLGVIKAVLNITDIAQTIDAFGAQGGVPGAFLQLVDADGRIVHHQDNPKLFRSDVSDQRAVRLLRGKQTGSVIEVIDGQKMLRAYAPPRPGSTLLRWSLILNQPTGAVFARADELRRWMVIVGVLASIAAGLLGFFLAQAFRRATQRLAAASTALEHNEARLRSVVDGAVDGIVTIRTDGTIESMNPACAEIFGYAEVELVGKNVSVLMPPPHAAKHDSYIERYVSTDVPHVIGTLQELRGCRKDGTIFPMDLSVSEVRTGDLRLFVGILRDVTTRHEAHAALEAAKESAEQASRSKGQFLANMSHELRTPLNAIIGYAEMVGEELVERKEPELVSDLGKIQAAGKHLLGLINDILDVSKIEAGRMEVHLESVDVRAFLDEVVATVHPLMETNQNELVLDAAEALGRALTDATKLRQVLFNLLSNAAKFTEQGRVILRARRAQGKRREWLELSVSDTGIGMTADQLEHVWEAFAQADASTTRAFGGTGLGLTISRSFCEMLGGSIDVESKPGAGTAFSLRLPVSGTPGAKAQAASAEPRAPSADSVLVIDDDPAARDLVRRYLVREGMEVATAASGSEGLALAASVHPSVILLDVMMPGMDGWAVLDALKRDPALADIPVVMLTMVDERRLGFALGVDAYVTKPVDSAGLLGALAPYRMKPGSHTVLVVEDEEDTRTLLVRQLTGLGWSVVAATDGQEALECLAATRIDLIVTDLMMPRMDGFELVERLSRDPGWRSIPVVVLTAKDITPEEAARLEGAIEHLMQKGRYDREALLSEIGRLVRTAVMKRRARQGG